MVKTSMITTLKNLRKDFLNTRKENLNKLDLSNNQLKYFQDKWVSKIISSSLSSLKLNGNPFYCDCQLTDANMHSFLQNTSAKKLIEYALYAGQEREFKLSRIV